VTQVYFTWINTEKFQRANKDVEKSILLTYALRVLCACLAFSAVKTNHGGVARRNNHKFITIPRAQNPWPAVFGGVFNSTKNGDSIESPSFLKTNFAYETSTVY
jgi:hypothetical protein